MSDVNANIGVHIDTSSALAELKALQKQLALFHGSVSKGSAAAATAQVGLQQNLLNSINATGKFTAQMGVVRTSTESFTHSLEKNKLTMGEYFKYAGASTKIFGKLFKSEFDTISRVAEERVKKMQTQYIKMGRDASGAMKGMSITPNVLNMKDYGVQTAIAAQKQALFNQLIKQGSTNLLNFGKNTQWAGRQLMVGFTVPLMYFGTAAGKVFMDLEKQTIKFKRVYGDMFTTPDQADKALEDIQKLANEYTKYGVQVTKTIEMAAQAAAMGKTGADLIAQVEGASRLAVLGGVEQEQALETTISLTNAFGIATEDLARKVNFLNAVENQTVLSIEDLTIAVPKAGPVIKQLGGDVEDLAFFMTAMKEGGINASEGANALKSGLASLINPSKKASEFLGNLGINIKGIVEANAGDVKATVIAFSQALDTLDPLNRARAIEQLFGKFQFSRLSTLFQNVTKDGTQAAKTLQLAGASIEELAILSERELKTVEDAVGTNFKEAIEQLKVSIAPIGKEFLKAVTPIVKFIGNLLEKFNGLSDGTKKFIVIATSLVGIVGPVLLMTFGLLANGAANIIKLFLAMRQGFMRLGGNSKLLAEQTTYLNSEQLEAATVAASLSQVHSRLTQQFQIEAGAVKALRDAYISATVAATRFAAANPGMILPGARGPRGGAPRKYADGVTMVPGTGTGDTVPAMLTPGEGVVPAHVMKDKRAQALVGALISGKLFEYNGGTKNAGGKDNFTHVGGQQTLNISDLLEDPSLSETDRARLTFLKGLLESEKADATAKKYHALGFTFDAALNDKMSVTETKKDPGISYADFEAEWDKQGYKKWEPSGILELNAVDFDDELKAKIKALSAGGTVNDDIIQAAFKDLSPEMKQTSAYKRALAKFETFAEYEVKKGIPSTTGGLKEALEKAAKSGKIPNLDVIEVDGDNFKSQLKGGGERVEFDEEIKDPKYRDKHVLVTRTDSSGKKVVSSFWGTTAIGEPHTNFNRLGKSKRFGVGEDPSKKVRAYKEKEQAIVDEANKNFKASSLKKEKPADLGRKIGNNPGRSFGVDGVGGFYEKPDGTRVFAKPVLNETAALAEIRATQIARDVHGLDTPLQKMIVMKDPVTGAKIIGLESPMEERFTPKMMTGEFSKDDYFKQTVAAALRGDADLAPGNMSGGRLTDVGPAGVFSSASGNNTYAESIRSMEDQARIFLSEGATKDENGKPIPRKTAFRTSTLDMISEMSSDEYAKMMRAEIDEALPKLRKIVADPAFGLTDADRPIYQAMIERLEAGQKVDWRKLHEAHTGIVIQKGEALQDKKTKKITPAKGTKKPANVKADSGDVKDNILIPKPPKGKDIVKTGKPKKSAAPRIIRPGRSDAPYANPYDGMSDDQKIFEKSLRRQNEKLQKEKLAALKLEEKELRTQETLKRKIAKSRGEANYNRFTGSGMTPEQIATAKSIQRNRGTQNQISPYANSGMTTAEISKARKDSAETVRAKKAQASELRREQQQAIAYKAAEKRAEKARLKKQEYRSSPEYKQQRMMRMQGVGMAAGMASSAAYMSGNTGAGNALAGLSVASTILPMLKGPIAAFAVAALAVGVVLLKFHKDLEEARKRGVEYAKAMTMGKDKIIALSKVTGTVSASESEDRRRADALSGGSAVQRKTGQTILESDFGKGLLKDIEAQATNNVDNKDIAKNIGTNLAKAVMQGVISTDQAKSISMALGEKLKNHSIAANISGRIVTLLGPNGENLARDPLSVAVEIQKQSMSNVETTFKSAMEKSVTTTYATNMAQLVGGAVVTGIGAVVAGAGVATAWAGGAGLLGIAGGAATMGAGTGIMLDAKQEQKKLEISEELKAASVQLGIQELAQNQGLIDSLNKQYDIKLKTAKTTAEINAIEDERAKSIDAVAANNKKALEYLISQKDLIGDSAFTTAVEAEVTNRYKDAGAMKAFADQAIKDLKALGDSDFKTQIGLEFAADNLDPMTVMSLVKMAQNNSKIESEFNLLVTATGSTAEAGMMLGLLTKAGVNETTMPIYIEFLRKGTKKEIKKKTDALAWLGDMKTKYGIEIDINKNGVQKIKNVMSIMNKLEGDTKKPFTKAMVIEELRKNPNDPGLKQIVEYWDQITNGKSTVTKQVLVDFVAGNDTNMVQRYFEATGMAVPSFANEKAKSDFYKSYEGAASAYFVSGQGKDIDPYAPPKPGPNDGKETKARDTTLDDLLKKLKLTRDASINAEGGLNELRKVFKKSAGDIKVFNGVNQQLRKLYGADSTFIDFIGGMDNAVEKGYIKADKLKKGIVRLTDDGIKAMKLYKEAQLGAFGEAANEAIKQSQKQRSGFVALKSAGASSADALEMVSDANFAISLSAATSAVEVKRLIEQFKEQRKEAEKTLIATDPLQYFNNQNDVMNQKFDVDERQIRAQFEPGIEAAQTQIDKQNEIIRLKQYELETDEKINTKKLDGINKEIDGIQRRIALEVDSQLTKLSDESAKYSEDMAVMNKTIDGINEKYDLQEKALGKISQINQDIIDQKKSQISLADALTSGDISAAAQAAQAMQEQSAAVASRSMSENLASAREAAIDGVKSSSGMTMDQIQERQYQIDRLSYALGIQKKKLEDQIAIKQEEIYQINVKREEKMVAIKNAEAEIYKITNESLIPLQNKLKDALDKVTDQRKEWDLAKLAIDVATVNTEAFRAKVSAAQILVKSISDLWKDIKDKDLTLTLKKIEETISNGIPYVPPKTQTTPEADAAAAKANAMANFALAKTGAEVSAAVTEGTKAGLTPSVIANSMIPGLLNSGMSQAEAAMTARWTGQGLQAQAQQDAAAAAKAAAASAQTDSAAALRRLTGGQTLSAADRKMLGMSSGGMVPKYFSVGGMARGTDTVPAMLTPGEFIVNAKSAQAAGPLLAAINSPSFNGFKTPQMSGVGANTATQNSSSMYNYSVGINVNQSNASADDIAKSVMTQIKYIDSQRIRGQK